MLNGLAEKQPWLLDPEHPLRTLALAKIHHQCTYVPNWVVQSISCRTKYSNYKATHGEFVLEWTNQVMWDQVGSTGRLRSQTIDRKKSSWAIEKLVFLASAPGSGLDSIPPGLLRVIARYAVEGFVYGH